MLFLMTQCMAIFVSRRSLGSLGAALILIPGRARADVVVVGASGRTGLEVVRYCVASGRPVRACTRNGEFDALTLLGGRSPLVTPVTADVTQVRQQQIPSREASRTQLPLAGPRASLCSHPLIRPSPTCPRVRRTDRDAHARLCGGVHGRLRRDRVGLPAG